MQDVRVQFLCKEKKEVITFLSVLLKNILNGIESINCHNCNASFKRLKESQYIFIFAIVNDYNDTTDDVLKFCCLKCCKIEKNNLMEVIELYPTLTLQNVNKLMYYGMLKKFMFDFHDSDQVSYKKYVISSSLSAVLDQMFLEKQNNEEIIRLSLRRNNQIVAEDFLHDLRVDYCDKYNFEKDLSINKEFVEAVDAHCNLNVYHLDVYYKTYNLYSPFVVQFNRNNLNECAYCVNKINKETNHPILHCSLCGATDPNYFIRNRRMMIPFWRADYNYNLVYWRLIKNKNLPCSLMMYAVDVKVDV
ncbi:me53 [Adoxophyes orana granulovirus]|uniref:ME53 n=1 Tax=Adoxophyes orana granulovirus TaxID=170617 RepID=Q91B75_GVAO|nr:me53 [Adoxophyes orana granulovirus]AAL02081.1 ME53 [Adoxophyes orana granulovirus]AAP85756.1 me53 [Adoxophyes orana granulovirus]